MCASFQMRRLARQRSVCAASSSAVGCSGLALEELKPGVRAAGRMLEAAHAHAPPPPAARPPAALGLILPGEPQCGLTPPLLTVCPAFPSLLLRTLLPPPLPLRTALRLRAALIACGELGRDASATVTA